MKQRSSMAIYEVHPGSWKKHEAEMMDDPGFIITVNWHMNLLPM